MEEYNFKEAEKRIRDFWEKEKIFKFDSKSNKKAYSIDTPPPTVSGKMHIGHAFSYSQQDFVIRFKRMNGFNVFYPFGTDDNGLPTERLVEKEKKIRARDMSRQEFTQLCLNFLKTELPRFIQDWKNVGISADFDLYYSTINEHCRKISQWSFLDLHKKNRAYRKKAPFMWCPECQTAIAQYELKDLEENSPFVFIKFKVNNGKTITIATTRPELLPACVAIHVNPQDKRFKDFIGKRARLPIFGREVQIYSNKDVDMEFGTGAVYHCTFGDMDDVQWINDMKIAPIEIMNKDGTLNEKAGKYKGMKSKEIRKEIIKDLEEIGAIEKVERINHAVKVHERCDTPIEILMTYQWFIKILDLKKEMLKWGADLKWHPEFMKHRYDNWVNGLKWDWCISRQRFFGVPFPVWYCKKCGSEVIAEEKQLPVDPLKNKPIAKCKCGSSDFEPERDILDTWFTSSMTPRLSTELEDKKTQEKIFPMSLRPQAHDIITFWLFNTLLKSNLHFGKNPWKDVMISGFVTLEGEKMSKSKGNVIDPRIVLEQYGADALRFWAAGSKLGEDLDYQEKDLLTGKKFVTKLWNASKFVFMNLEDYNNEKPKKLDKVDELFLEKLNSLTKFCTDSFDNYEYSKVKMEVEKFFWQDFCDNYLEIVKHRVYNASGDKKKSAQYVLYNSLLAIIKMIAPFMPFITEEIYQNYFKKNEKAKSIHISEWPKEIKTSIKEDKKEYDLLVELITKIRQEKTLAKKSMKAEVILHLPGGELKSLGELTRDLQDVMSVKDIKEGKFRVEF
jgi:valyl-tRNA synthetase